MPIGHWQDILWNMQIRCRHCVMSRQTCGHCQACGHCEGCQMVVMCAANCADIMYCQMCEHCADCVDIVYDQTCGHCAELKWLWSGAGDTFHTRSHTDWQPQPCRPEYLIELIPHTMLKLLPASIHWIYHHLRLHMLRGTIFVNKSHTRCSTLLHSFKDVYLNVQICANSIRCLKTKSGWIETAHNERLVHLFYIYQLLPMLQSTTKLN